MKNYLLKSVILITLFAFAGCSSSDDNPSNPVVTKTKVTVTSWAINAFPPRDPNNDLWDITNDPDVYSGIYNNSTLVSLSTTIQNANNASLPITATLVTAYSTTNLTGDFLVIVMDDDTNDTPSTADDAIGSVRFNINDYTSGTNKYPSSVQKSEGGVMITLYLTWE